MTTEPTATAQAFRDALIAKGIAGTDLDDFSQSFDCAEMTTNDGDVDGPRIASFVDKLLPGAGTGRAPRRRDFGGGSRIGEQIGGHPEPDGKVEAQRRYGQSGAGDEVHTTYRNAEAMRRYEAKSN